MTREHVYKRWEHEIRSYLQALGNKNPVLTIDKLRAHLPKDNLI